MVQASDVTGQRTQTRNRWSEGSGRLKKCSEGKKESMMLNHGKSKIKTCFKESDFMFPVKKRKLGKI